MSTLLYIESSPRKDRSHSTAVADAFLAAYRQAHPTDTIATLDLWATKLPPFDGATIAAKYAVLGGAGHTAEEAAAWGEVVRHANDFKAADKIVISVPMWNFGIPYVLKHYLDVIVQPGLTFGWSAEKGYFGLVLGKPVTIIAASGGSYPAGTDAEKIDFQVPYLKWILTFMGFTDIKVITVDPMLAGPDDVASGKARALAAANAAGQAF